MNLKQLIEILTNSLNRINSDLAVAQSLGDLERFLQLQSEAAETQGTIQKLKTLEG
jgi:hypothetical protein